MSPLDRSAGEAAAAASDPSLRADAVEPSEWREYLRSFGRQHHGWRVTLERRGRTIGRPSTVEGTLDAVALDEPGTGIRILLTDPEQRTIDVMIPHVSALRVTRTEAGADWVLEVESKTGDSASLAFKAPMLPEMVDGLP